MPTDLPGKRLPAENWHLTLRFLGDTPPALRDGLVAELESTTLGEPFAVRFGGLGAFPHPRRARVLWLGVAAGAAGLRALAAATEEAAQRAGFPAADKPFSPHLTLSRIRPPRSVAALLQGAGPLDGGMEAAEVVLYRSHRDNRPARYEAIAQFALP